MQPRRGDGTGAAGPPEPERHRAWSETVGKIRSKDPAGLALKRSVRAAVLVPLVFGLTHLLFSNPQVSLFAAFGSFALLLLVDFPGRRGTRLISYVALFAVGSGFIAVGTVLSTYPAPAVAAMAVVGFAVLFAGIVAPQAASASTAALLLFVLPVAVAQPAGAVGPRLVGWAFAGAFCIPACLLIWPPPWHDELRHHLSTTISAVGRLVLGTVGKGPDPEAEAVVTTELTGLRDQFRGTPYPPTGSVAGAVALAKLVGRVEWVAGNASRFGREAASASVRAVIEAAAETLRLCASLVCDGDGYPVDDPALIQAVQVATQRLDHLIVHELDEEVSTLLDPDAPAVGRSSVGGDAADGRDVATWLDPSFHARALGIATEMLSDAAVESAGAHAVGDRTLGTSAESSVRSVWSRLASHLSFHSVWFRNAVRGGAGLALAVAVVEITDVEHGFWVVLGTLSVLRSNALGTGSTALRAVGGTAVGFVVGSAIMVGVANHTVLLWVLLPVAVLVAGVAPSVISFAAGQAGFTLVVIILFNIIEPTGWKVGLTRIEDVAIGCGVSIVVGLLFWPRGASAALGRALSDAFIMSSGYLSDAVSRLTTWSHEVDTLPGQRASHRAYLRLDDAFRQYLAERGAKTVSVETVSNLFTGSNRIRLAAYTLASLPVPAADADQPELESVTIAGAVLRDSYATSHRWYEEFAELLADKRTTLDPPPLHDHALEQVLVEAFEDARNRRRADRLRTTLRMLWADDLLENQRQVQADLAASADDFARQRHRG
ncbi:MAG: FUSC family protein [Acidimicrobiales bacterium]